MNLTQYLGLYAGPEAFSWADRNCSTFCAGWVLVREQFNPMDGLGEIQTERDARRVVGRLGGLRSAWTKQLGREPRAGMLAQPGDVVLVPANSEGGEAVGLCVGAEVAVLLSTGTIGFLPLSVARASWGIK